MALTGRRRVLIMGAAGRDFHNFNMVYRHDPTREVIAFTATQIPDIAGRRYPAELAGELYPTGIPIFPEAELEALVAAHKVDEVVFAYSDVTFDHVMECASRALAAGADFGLLGPEATWLHAAKPVIAICAVRTGSGKSQTTRLVAEALKAEGLRFCVVRHPMPYGDLARQALQRFDTLADLDTHQCTIEEREEYEPHLNRGTTVYAGVDYGMILADAEADFDLILWDGGNNDLPFYAPDLLIVVADPWRAGHELRYHPGATVFRRADVIVINKVGPAVRPMVDVVRANARRVNPRAQIVEALSTLTISDPAQIRGQAVLVVEDGPTLTHGGMSFGAGVVAAQESGARELVDPRPYAVGSIRAAYEQYPHIGRLVPALGYSRRQIGELEATINTTPCDAVVIATPIDLLKVLKINKPAVRVEYELEPVTRPSLFEIVAEFLARRRA